MGGNARNGLKGRAKGSVYKRKAQTTQAKMDNGKSSALCAFGAFFGLL